MSYEEQPTNRIDIAERQRKRQAQANESMDWRNSSNNRVEDFDANFKTVVKAEKQRRIKQGSQQLTKQQIEDRVARQDIIQQAVKAGTYTDPRKPWNRIPRWIEDGDQTQ